MKVGTLLQETQFYIVKEIHSDYITVTINGQEVNLGTKYVEKYVISADEYSSTKKMSRTDLNHFVKTKQGTLMTLCFDKQVDLDNVKKLLDAGKIAETKQALIPEQRIIKGVHHGLDEHGRYNFIDMELPKESGSYDSRLRHVDPRTIKYCICAGVKYECK